MNYSPVDCGDSRSIIPPGVNGKTSGVRILPACLLNARNLTLVGELSEANTANTVVAQIRVGSAADLAAVIVASRELGVLLLLHYHRLSSHYSFLRLVVEGSAHHGQQLFCLFIRLGSGADNDVHAADGVYLVVLDFGEDQLLLDAEAVVASAVEGVGVDTAEVTDTGNSHILS